MQRILRPIHLLLALIAILALAGCGGEEKVSEGTDPQALIDKTFSGEKDIKSGKLDVKINLDITGDSSGVNGPVSVTLSGPFESQGAAKLPKFALQAAFSGAGQSIKAGVTSTGDKGFVSFNGTNYVVGAPIFGQFRTAYEQAAKQSKGNSKNNQSLASLGIDPRRWLVKAKNAGEAKVGDADTVKLTGEVDIPKLLDDVNTALGKAGSLGLGAAGALPTKITDEQKKQVADAIKNLAVEIYTGKEDAILRRMVISLDASDPTDPAGGKARVNLDFSLLDLNKGQEFSEPANPKPINELLESLGGLGLGGLGGSLGGGSAGGGTSGSSGGGSGSGGSSGSGSGGSGEENLEKYTECVKEAGQDLEKAQKCADLLAP